MLALLCGFVASCNDETADVATLPEGCDPIALRGIQAVIDNGSSTRAVTPLVDSIGKYSFLPTDTIIFTKIERTRHPIAGFSYSNVRYSCGIDGTNVSWTREHPESDIFWSDGSEPHTFIGYILPHEDTKTYATSGYDWDETTSSWRQTGYDWHLDKERGVYYGSIGNPANTAEVIDYTATPASDRESPYDLEKLRKEDLLLAYDTDMQNVDAMAWVHFHHALASVRIRVTITGYSATGTDPDAETMVTGMVLHDQPTMYKWDNQGYQADSLKSMDQSVLNSFTDWGGAVPRWNQKKEMRLWQPRTHHGTGASRTFSFYGIVAPSNQDEVKMTFDVSYPDPLDPNGTARLEKLYTATLKLDNGRSVEFRPGYCTCINVNLNHKDEKLTVGAEYMSWQMEDSPDDGQLSKNTTFLSYTDRSKITIVGDEKATADDATWLYSVGKDASNNDIVKDIYGHEGNSATDPYTISTADQLLSFAYEVKNGRDFVHKYVKLDADITLQKEKNDSTITWIGIGDDTHPFNGFFLGSGRFINKLKGEHFFYAVGNNAVIDKVNFENVIEVRGCGVVAHQNDGLICGCYLDGDVKETSESAQYTGSIVGINNSFIIACAHVGKVEGRGIIGGLVGFNNGTVMASYHCGAISALDGSTNVHATVGKRGDKSIMFSCYYDKSLITHTPTLEPGRSGYPLSTSVMQSNAFVNGENVFTYDESGLYTGQGKNLRGVVIEILDKAPDTTMTNDELLAELLANGVVSSENIDKLFGYHFSLNEALRVFRLWLGSIAANALEQGDDYKVQTNCHEFSRLQILFLKQHYTDQHIFIYTPATYPKVQ